MNSCAEIADNSSPPKTWLNAGLRIAVLFLLAAFFIPVCVFAASPAQDVPAIPSAPAFFI